LHEVVIEAKMMAQDKLKINSEIKTLMNGNETLINSSKLLMFNVEGSLGVAQIYCNQFIKQIERFSVKKAVEEVLQIFKRTAKSKQIRMNFELIDFPYLDKSENNKPRDQIISNQIKHANEDQDYIVRSDIKRF
jgi:hypothetical protein